VCLLGAPRLRHDGPVQADVRLTRLLLSLFAYLLLHADRGHPRDVLVGMFWGDETDERARGCLATALWRLRRALGTADRRAGGLIASSAGAVHVDGTVPYWLDVAELEDGARAVLPQPVDRVSGPALAALARAVRLYRGDLLEGCYDEWVLRERERLRLLYHSCLVYLMQYYSRHGAWHESLGFGGLLLQHDPLREDVHREMMRLYARSGQRALAVRQYQLCRAALQRELSLPPMEETTALFREVVHSEEPAPDGEHPVDLAFVLQKANAARRTLEATVDELRRLINVLEARPAPPLLTARDDSAPPIPHLLDL